MFLEVAGHDGLNGFLVESTDCPFGFEVTSVLGNVTTSNSRPKLAAASAKTWHAGRMYAEPDLGLPETIWPTRSPDPSSTTQEPQSPSLRVASNLTVHKCVILRELGVV